jgi:hypothetical protein
VKKLFLLWLCGFSAGGFAQTSPEEASLLSGLTSSVAPPEGLLAKRAVVLYQLAYTEDELNEIQKYFQQTGIDAIAYFETDRVLAGPDLTKAFADYFNTRNVSFFVFAQKEAGRFRLLVTPFSKTVELVSEGSGQWVMENPSLRDLLQNVYRSLISSQKRQNFLINDLPERDIPVKNFTGRRYESFSKEATYFKVAIPRLASPDDNKKLEEILRLGPPLKFDLVPAEMSERELNNRGYIFILRFVRARGSVAKEILGYERKVEQTYASVVTTPEGVELKTLPSTEHVFKFYFKHIEYGNIYLGTRWDADTTWEAALKNHLQAMKSEIKP